LKLPESYDALMRAEVTYAHFNARRTSKVGPGRPPELVELEYGFGLADSSRPSSPYYNRVVLAAGLQESDLHVGRLPASVQAVEVQMPQQTAEFSKRLAEGGWLPAGSLSYLQASPDVLRSETHRVVRLGPDQTPMFFDLIDLPPEKRKPEFYCTEQFRCYAAYTESDEVAAWATMYVGSQFVFLGNAETRTEYRNQGFHLALLTARLNDVISMGLGTAYTDVVPGSQSHQNCEREGLNLLAVNQLWGRKSKHHS
jgi:hypothetical protein